MAAFNGIMLYEETKVALTKLGEASKDNALSKPLGLFSTEAIEHMMDMLRLEAQPEVVLSEVSGESVEVATSTPSAMYLGEFAMNLGKEEPSPMEQQVLHTRCTFVASLPDRLANILLGACWAPKSLEIDVDLLTTRICQALSRFLFAIHASSANNVVDAIPDMKRYRFRKTNGLFVCEAMIQSLVRRGYIRTFFYSFVGSIRTGVLSSVTSDEVVPFVFLAIYRCGFKGRQISREDVGETVRVKSNKNLYWSEWNAWFLQVAEKDAQFKKLFVTSLIKMLKPLNGNCKAPNDMLSMAQALVKEIFVTKTSYIPSARGVLRVIFRDVLPFVVCHSGEDKVREVSDVEMSMFTEVFQRWGARDVVEKESAALNRTLANAVLYVLLHIKEYHTQSERNHLPSTMLQPLLAGVSARFEILRTGDIKAEAITVASAFASFFVGDEESRRAFSNLEQFPALLNDWLKSELDPMSTSGLLPISHKDPDRETGSKGQPELCRRCLEAEEYPLSPDDGFTFFSRRTACALKKQASFGGVAVVFNQEGVVNHEHLPSFGKISHEQDELEENVTILVTLRESYNAIMGIGRSTHAQMFEVQQATESGLRGFFFALSKLKEKLGIWKEQNVGGDVLRSREKIGKELNPMISGLLPALISLSIYAPEERQNELMDLRYSVLVSLIIITPENTLTHLSAMMYSSRYGVFQRVEMAKAIGDAARYLSQVEMRIQGPDGVQKDDNPNTRNLTKRIYPPIPSEGSKHVSITVSEGKETRRWGNAVTERVERKTQMYTSYLADVVYFFISALLARAEDDHFAFFGDGDPYVPSEVIRSISTVVQCVAAARHVAPTLCENIMTFALAVVTQHPVSVVRNHGWVLIGEIMRCWCGAGPFVPNSDFSVVSHGVCRGSFSCMFSQQWHSAWRALENVFEKTKEDPSCVEIASMVLADLQDLVLAKQGVEAMENRVNTRRVLITEVAKSNIKII